MSNRLLTLQEVSSQMLADLNRVCDEFDIPQEDRAQIAVAALGGLMYGPMRPEDFQA